MTTSKQVGSNLVGWKPPPTCFCPSLIATPVPGLGIPRPKIKTSQPFDWEVVGGGPVSPVGFPWIHPCFSGDSGRLKEVETFRGSRFGRILLVGLGPPPSVLFVPPSGCNDRARSSPSSPTAGHIRSPRRPCAIGTCFPDSL